MEAATNLSLYKNENDTSGSGFNTEVYDQIVRFLKEHSRNSVNTSMAYERDIRYFFNHTRKKEIEHLKREELVYSIDEIEDFQSHIIDELELSVSTSNRYITSISECFKHLKRRGLIVDIDFLDIKRPVASPNSYDGFTAEEIEKIVKEVATIGRKKTAKHKVALINYTYDTCSRIEECLNLTWDDFRIEEQRGIVKVRTVAKGNKVMNREISLNEYNKLLELKDDKTNKVFQVSESSITRMMIEIRSILNINENNRRIVFHSFRKAGAQWIFELTRDINQVRQALGHESIKTTEIYINKNEYYGVMGARSTVNGISNSLYKEVPHDDLLQAIDELTTDKKMFINLKLNELLNKTN